MAEGGQMGQIEQWRYTSWKSARKSVLVGVGSPEEAGREDPGVRATKSFESRKEVGTLDGLISSGCSIAPTTLPGHIFSAH